MLSNINGKMYNTDTAKEIGGWWNGLSTRDFNHRIETLYLKKTGEYFLHGQGGPLTSYSRSIGNSRYGGEKIIPISEKEARAWAENNLSTDEYIAAFGEPEE